MKLDEAERSYGIISAIVLVSRLYQFPIFHSMQHSYYKYIPVKRDACGCWGSCYPYQSKGKMLRASLNWLILSKHRQLVYPSVVVHAIVPDKEKAAQIHKRVIGYGKLAAVDYT